MFQSNLFVELKIGVSFLRGFRIFDNPHRKKVSPLTQGLS